MASEELHLDRARAESFGSVAEQYDRYRPACPDALIEDLVALRPEQVLDVGCGTGKVAVPLAKHGLSVLGVEVDDRMAEVSDVFSSVETRKYRWERTLSADEWVGLAGTFSDHQRLVPECLALLRQALQETIKSLGGSVHARGETYALLARRV